MAFGDLINRQTSQTPNISAMNVTWILNKTISFVTLNMHATRRKSLLDSVASLLAGASATVTGIGRGLPSEVAEKHKIKRSDRLLSNRNLLSDLPCIYSLMTRLFTSLTPNPVIHIDWSDLDEFGRHYLIRASLAFDGRSITLYEEVHDVKTKEKPATHKQFLKMLKAMLPEDSMPVIVTDAGFKGPWFRTIRDMGWHFVGRARMPNFWHNGDGQWRCISSLYPNATNRPKVFTGQLCRYQPMDTLFVLYKQNPKGRHKVTRKGKRSQFKYSETAAKRNRDPWLLVTSLPETHNTGKKVVDIYKTRMQIEEAFRDMKRHRFGLGFDNNRSRKKTRVSVLIMLSTLANLVTLLIGWTVYKANKHRKYQANTTRNRRVLSFHFVGLRAFIDRQLELSEDEWESAILKFKTCLQEANDVFN